MSVSAITVQAKQVERLEAEKAELRVALTCAANALARVVATSDAVDNARSQAFAAERFASAILAKTKEEA